MALSAFDLIRSNQFYATVLAPERGAEQVTFFDATCPQGRPVVMHVEGKGQEQDSRSINRKIDRILAICGRDETNLTKSGVDHPQTPCTLLRAGDEPQVRYAWTGEVERETAWSWHLIFERPSPRRIGTAHRA